MQSISKLGTDVLVIGAGMAGIMAAIEASDSGAKVTIVSKGPFGRDGAATWMAWLGLSSSLVSTGQSGSTCHRYDQGRPVS